MSDIIEMSTTYYENPAYYLRSGKHSFFRWRRTIRYESGHYEFADSIRTAYRYSTLDEALVGLEQARAAAPGADLYIVRAQLQLVEQGGPIIARAKPPEAAS